MGIYKYMRLTFVILLVVTIMFLSLFLTLFMFMSSNMPFGISNSGFKIDIFPSGQIRLRDKSSREILTRDRHSCNNSKLLDKYGGKITLPISVNISLAPATLFNFELGDLAARLLDPPVPAITRPLHIVLMGGFNTPYGNIPGSDRVIVDTKCSVPPNACSFSDNRSKSSLSTADMLLWQNAVPNDAILSSFKRPREQIWVITLYESPLTDKYSLQIFDNDQRRLNWTTGYRLDSILPDPYERLVSKQQLEQLVKEVESWPPEYKTSLVIEKVKQIRIYLNNYIGIGF
jgi:hypothetical protein